MEVVPGFKVKHVVVATSVMEDSNIEALYMKNYELKSPGDKMMKEGFDVVHSGVERF